MGDCGAAARATLQFGLANTQQEPSPSLSAFMWRRHSSLWRQQDHRKMKTVCLWSDFCCWNNKLDNLNLRYVCLNYHHLHHIWYSIFDIRVDATPFLKKKKKKAAGKCHCKIHMCYSPLTLNKFTKKEKFSDCWHRVEGVHPLQPNTFTLKTLA